MNNYKKSYSPGDLVGPENSPYRKQWDMGGLEGPKEPERPKGPSVVARGSMGSITWQIDSNGLLKLQGTGAVSHEIWGNCYDKNSNSLIQYAKQIRDIHVAEGITEIGDVVFRFSDARTISLPSTLTHIGYYAFAYSEFAEITVPANVVSIRPNAFDGCKKLKKVKMPERFNKKLVYSGLNIFSPLESYRSFESYHGIPRRIVTFY